MWRPQKLMRYKKQWFKKKQVLSLTCVQWRIFLPSCTRVPLDFPGQIVKSPQVLSQSACSGHYFSLAAPMCQLDFPGQIPTSLSMKPMRWEFFMGCTCYSPNTCVMWTYPKSALTPFSCVQTVGYSVTSHKPWECKNLMQVSFKWLIEPHAIGVWHLQRAKTFTNEIGNQKTGPSDSSYLTCR